MHGALEKANLCVFFKFDNSYIFKFDKKTEGIYMKKLNYRQVHLDFHTSESIVGIGERFNKEEFITALKIGRVESITLFSKCHHGWSYHPTDVGEMHPHLKFDLLASQLDACKEAGVNAPVYLSSGVDVRYIRLHPECAVKPEPNSSIDFLNHAGFYQRLCYNTPYLEYLALQVEEVMKKYDPVGIFLDLCSPQICYCNYCLKSMREKGLDPHDKNDLKRHADMVYDMYGKRMEQAVRKYNRNTTIFHNGGNATWGRRDFAKYNTHLELESLPTGGWGYDHFPMSAAYARTLETDYLGMTGKFHLSWGEFGGFKHPNALRYEVALSIAEGAKCSIGDQLHPSGKINISTYKLIGKAYAEVEAKEPYVREAEYIADIAILRPASFANVPQNNPHDIGASRILLEGKYLYNMVDEYSDISQYKLIILPDVIRIDEQLEKKLMEYIINGGKILFTGESGLRKNDDTFAVEIGAECEGKNDFCPTYMIPEYECINGKTEYVMYTPCINIKATGGKIAAMLEETYFNRTPEHFCSHAHTPNAIGQDRVGAVLTQNTAYIAWKVFEDYAQYGSFHTKELVLHMIKKLLPEPTATASLPDRGVFTFTYQAAEKRYVAHLLFAHTTRRGNGVEVIEDIVSIHNVKMTAHIKEEPKNVYKVWHDGNNLCKEQLTYSYSNGSVEVDIDIVELHAMIVIDM